MKTLPKLKTMDAEQLTAEILSHRDLADDLREPIEFSTALHAGQTRRESISGRTNTPYIEHVLRVCLRLIRLGIRDIDTLKGALFHDVVEDCSEQFMKVYLADSVAENEQQARDITSSYIAAAHGNNVREIVAGVTLPIIDPEVKKSQTIEERNAAYLVHVESGISTNPGSYFDKFSDFFDNGGSLHHAVATDPETGKFVNPSKQVTRSATKYLPMVDIFEKYLDKDYLGVDQSIIDEMEKCLHITRVRLKAIIEASN